MITRQDIYDAYAAIRGAGCKVPIEVLDFMEKSAIEKLERTFRPTTVEDMEKSPYFDKIDASLEQSSGHSFTEGMGFTPFEPTIAQQITWLQEQLATKELGHASDYFRSMIKVLSRIEVAKDRAERRKKELNSLQQFVLEWAGFRTLEYEPKTNEHSIYGERKLDLEKVIDDLIQVIADAGLNRTNGVPIPSIQNAEAALGMLQAFKGKTITAKDVADAHHAGKNVLDRKTWSQYPKEMQKKVEAFDLRGMLVDRMVDVQGKYAIADAIVMAIELKSNGTNRA